MSDKFNDYTGLINKITFGKSKLSLDQVSSKKKLIVDFEDKKEMSMVLKENKNNAYVKLNGNLFQYEGTTIHIIYEDNEYWFRGKDCANILEYQNTKVAISYNVDKNDMKILGDFKGQIGLPLKGNAKSTIYINKKGLFSLIMCSKMKEAKKFQKWIMKLLVKIDNGENIYEEQPNVQDYIVIPSTEFKDWALTHNTSELRGENVLYIGVIGKITNIKTELDTNVKNDELIFKYGLTFEEFRREKEHRVFIETYMCIYIIKCIKFKQLEDDLKYELERKGLKRHLKFNGKNYTELFTVSDYFTFDGIISFVEKWVKNNDFKIDELELAREQTKIEEAKAKQEKEKTKQLLIELEMLKIKSKHDDK